MYLCDICRTCSPPGQPRLTFAVMRRWWDALDHERRDIAREVACCPKCKRNLDAGQSLAALERHFAPRRAPSLTQEEWQLRANGSVPRPVQVVEF